MKKSERLNQELIFLRDKYFFQLKDLMEEFAISKRTALRDIEELESMGLAFYVENGRHGGYRLINQSPLIPIYFNKEEVQAIFFALKALNVISSTPFTKSYSKIQQKLFATMPSSHQENISNMLDVVHYYNVAPVNTLNNLGLILHSVLEEKIVNVTYTQHGIIKTQLQIYELFYRNGIWFSSAYDISAKQWGTYRCDYMLDLVINEDISNTFTREELKQFQFEYENTYHNIPFKCRLTSFGKELFLKNNYPNMKLEIIDGIPYIIGGYNQEELSYMTHYLASFGKHVKIEFPKQLKDNYLKQLREILDSY